MWIFKRLFWRFARKPQVNDHYVVDKSTSEKDPWAEDRLIYRVDDIRGRYVRMACFWEKTPDVVFYTTREMPAVIAFMERIA